MFECSKSIHRRLSDPRFITRYFVGKGIDVGGGNDSLVKYKYLFPMISEITNYDRSEGDAQLLTDIETESLNFVHSSHCLEHLDDPYQGYSNWLRVLKPNGYMIVTVPDEDLYEQGVFPSTWSNEHKWTFTVYKHNSWSPRSINILDLLIKHPLNDLIDNNPWCITKFIKIEKIELINYSFNQDIPREDQTFTSQVTESCIEFIIQKLVRY